MGQLAWRRVGWGSRLSAKRWQPPWGSVEEPPERRAQQVLALVLRLLAPSSTRPRGPRLPPPPCGGRGAAFSAGTLGAGARSGAEAENPEVHPKPRPLRTSWLISFKLFLVGRSRGMKAPGLQGCPPPSLAASLPAARKSLGHWRWGGSGCWRGGGTDHSLAEAPHSAQEESFFLGC